MIEITVKVKVGKKEIVLKNEEARELYDKLHEHYRAKNYYPVPLPVYPRYPYVWYSTSDNATITFGSTTTTDTYKVDTVDN